MACDVCVPSVEKWILHKQQENEREHAHLSGAGCLSLLVLTFAILGVWLSCELYA